GDIPAGTLPAVVDDFDLRQVDDRPATTDAGTQVDVLAAKVIAFVPADDLVEGGSRHQHGRAHEYGHAQGPRPLAGAAAATTEAAITAAKQTGPTQQIGPMQQGGHRRQFPVRDLGPAQSVA